MTDTVAVSHRPTPLSSAIALALVTGVALLLAKSPLQRLTLLGSAVGVALLVAATHRPVATVVGTRAGTVVGAGLIAVALDAGLWTLGSGVAWAEYGPGLVAVVSLGFGLRPVRQRTARRFVSASLAALVVGVVLSGVFHRTSAVVLLTATVGAVVAWDVAENGISLGEQLRTDAETRRVELVHAGSSAGFGAVLVFGATVLYERGGTTLPLGVLLLLVAGAVISMAALYR